MKNEKCAPQRFFTIKKNDWEGCGHFQGIFFHDCRVLNITVIFLFQLSKILKYQNTETPNMTNFNKVGERRTF